MYIDKFSYVPSYEILPKVVDELQSLNKIIMLREEILTIFEDVNETADTNEFKQNVMVVIDDNLMKRIEKTVKFLKQNELFCEMFTNCEHAL